MIFIISPAKTLDFETKISDQFSNPRFEKETARLHKVLQKKSSKQLQKLMDISEQLAELNVQRYREFKEEQEAGQVKQAVYAFQGDVYQGLKAEELTGSKLDFMQKHLRILSGLYGLLRPFDKIQPYRLEMGTNLKIGKYQNLYGFWGDKITKELKSDLDEAGTDILLNLASQEYFKSVNRKKFGARVIDVEFLEEKNGQYKVISFFAKKARGLMARYIIDHEITDPKQLEGFDSEGYLFDHVNSNEQKLVFKRG